MRMKIIDYLIVSLQMYIFRLWYVNFTKIEETIVKIITGR